MLTAGKLHDLLYSKRGVTIAVAVGIAAILLILISSISGHGDAITPSSAAEYQESLKDQLLEIVSLIDGVGDVRIFLTMDNSGENVYLNNSDTKTKSITPTVRGVVIVCSGGDDPVVASRVLSAVTKSLSISSDKVCITKLIQDGGMIS